MTLLCLAIALALTVLLSFVSYVQLLYLESQRLIRHELPSLEFFRDTLAAKIGLDAEEGALAFSLTKHLSLCMAGVFFLCALVRPGVPHWQSVLEAIGVSFAAMLLSTYLVPLYLHRRTSGRWMTRTLPS